MMEISSATREDVNGILDFIRTDWKEDHYFIQDPDFFRYHYEGRGTEFNFILAKDSARKITGILGYMDYSEAVTGGDIFLSLWKVRASPDPTLGLKLLQTLLTKTSPRGVYCTGINKKTIGIYRYLGYHTGVMKRTFLPNPSLTKFDILKCENKNCFLDAKVSLQRPARIKNVDGHEFSFRFIKNKSLAIFPEKSPIFFERRFVNHPRYHYVFWVAEYGSRQLGIVTRELRARGKSSLRIVDMHGDFSLLSALRTDLLCLLEESGYEYVELTFAGLNIETVRQAGFLEASQSLILPAYFEPFEQANVDCFYFSSINKGFHLFLGDGDQDRPNEIVRESKKEHGVAK
jgi:hypothetical protein